MSVLAVAISQRAKKTHQNKRLLEHINKNYDHIPTLQEIDSDPFFDNIKIYDDRKNIFQRIKFLIIRK